MVSRKARRSCSLRHRLTRGGILPLILTLGGAIIYNSSPASAATSPTTDTISVVESGTTTLSESLPPGTPDVVTPLATALYVACAPFSGGTLILGAAQVCYTDGFGAAAGTVLVVAVQPSVGVLLPTGFTGSAPNCGIVALDGSVGVALGPPALRAELSPSAT